VTNPKLALHLILALLAIPQARAQVSVDVAKITCEQFILWKVTDPQNIAIWLSGYYNGKRGNTVIDTQRLKENTNKVRDYCRENLKLTVMQAVETVLDASQ
jgi:acid stress chaperone HdeB